MFCIIALEIVMLRLDIMMCQWRLYYWLKSFSVFIKLNRIDICRHDKTSLIHEAKNICAIATRTSQIIKWSDTKYLDLKIQRIKLLDTAFNFHMYLFPQLSITAPRSHVWTAHALTLREATNVSANQATRGGAVNQVNRPNNVIKSLIISFVSYFTDLSTLSNND